MSLLSPLQETIVTVIGWSLIHSLWLGVVIACCAWAVESMLRDANANTRYVVLLLAFVSIPAAAIVTSALMLRVPATSSASLAESDTRVADAAWTVNEENSTPASFGRLGNRAWETRINRSQDTSRNPTTQSVSSAASPNPARPESVSRPVANWIPWLVGAWAAGVGLFSLRLLLSCVSLRRLLACGTPVSQDVADMAARISRRIRLNRTIRVVESTLAEAPATIGFFQPVVLLPLSALSNLSAQELESILAHEIAHIYRYDFLVNVLQTILEVLLFYHPAVWWLSRRIRQEREHACDDMAIAVTGNRLQYARALATVAEHSMRSRLALTANGGQFSERIRRILGHLDTQPSTSSAVFSASLLATALVCMTLLFIPIAESTAGSADTVASNDSKAQEFIQPISGVILGPAGKPLSAVTVYLRRRPFRYHTGPMELAQTTTDNDGRFEFRDVVIPQITDVYQKNVFPVDVIAMKPGYSLRWRRLTNSQTDISLQLREETRFSGVLRDDAGQPVADATIRVRNLMSLNTITQIDVAGGHTTSQNGDSFLDISESVACIAATTDEAGRFALRELPNRVGMVLGIDDDRFVDTQWYAATTTEELPDIPAGKLIFPPRPKTAGQIIQQRVRAELLPIHVSLAKLPVTRGVHVRIRVLDDETGAPVSGAVVALAGDARSDLQTNDVGVCDVSRLVPEGSVVASVRPPEKSSLLGRSEPLALSSKLHVEREIRLKQGAIVTGRVMDAESGAGVADATVSFVPETGQVADAEQPIPATSDDAGAFRLVVPEVSGRVAVARPPAGYLQPSSAVSREGERGVTDSAITAKLDEPVEGLEIPLRRRPSIPFLFVDADGEPLAVTVDVRVFSSSNSYFSSIEEVDQSGMMDASLLIKSPQRPAAIQMLARSVDKRLAGFFRSKELTDLQGDEPYSIVLRPVASVEGQILDKETGRPISGARVRLSVSYTATGGQSVGSFTCGKEGRYKFQELVPGMRYALGVSADGYAALNSIHTRFVAAEGESHTVDIGLSPEKPKEVVGIEPVKTPAVDGLDPQEAYDVLAAAYDKAYNAYRDLLEKHESSQAKKQIVAIAEPTPVYATAFMKLANDNQGSSVELQALKWVCKARIVAGSERSHYPLRTEAAARLLADYRQREEIADAVSNIIYASSNAYDAAQRLMKSPHREVQGQAYYTCANILAQRYLDPHRGGHDVLREEAIALYEKVIEDYGEIVQWPGRSIGDAAREKLFELKKLQIGAAAPEIDGVDLDGKPMKLADFRGQVVVIYYWESGLAFFDRLKDMLDEYRGKPLVIVGVNTDRDRDLAITAAAQQGLAIRHWHDPERKIHRRWSGSWPDTHVIGHDGTLLYRGQRRSPKPLEDVLDQAVAAAEQAERE